jgi:hypothetical protein
VTQEQVKTEEHTPHLVETSFNDLECTKKLIPVTDSLNDSNVQHVKYISTKTIMSLNHVKNQTDTSQEHSKSTESITNFINLSYCCQQCQKKFAFAADHLEHYRTEHTNMKSFISTRQDCFIDSRIMKCPKAVSSTLVYLLLGTVRQQICITSGKKNRCLHQACKSITANYDFEQLCLHTTTEHENAQLRLECCDPMIMYTPEEYKNHLQHRV